MLAWWDETAVALHLDRRTAEELLQLLEDEISGVERTCPRLAALRDELRSIKKEAKR